MKILVFGPNYAPELTGVGKFTSEMCDYLSRAGHELFVITAPPHYPEWKVRSGYSAHRYRCEEAPSGAVLRCPIWIPRKQSGLMRILLHMSFALSSAPVLLWKALFWRPQLVWIAIPSTLGMPGALVAAKLAGAKSWLHVQDLEIDAAFDLGLLTSPTLRSWALRLESVLMRRFTVVSSITPPMLQKLAAKRIEDSRSKLFPNWVDTDCIFPLPRQSILRAQLGLGPADFVALYSGNLGAKQGLDILVGVARRLSSARGHIVVCGDGAGAKRLRAAAQGVSNIIFLPLQPLEHLNELLNLADVHLLPQRKSAGDLVMPSKLGGMLASGRPVVAGAAPGTQVAHAVEGAGIIVEPENTDAMAQAVLDLLEAAGRRAELAAHARERALQEWSRTAILERFAASLDRLFRTGR